MRIDACWQGRALAACLMGLGLGLPLAASAQGSLGFLKDSPISYFNNEDINLMKTNAYAVLDSAEQRAKGEWSNPKTRHSGQAEIMETFAAEGMSCKRLRLANAAKGVTSEATYPLCNYPGKGWRVRPE
jgi:hypothetical protein